MTLVDQSADRSDLIEQARPVVDRAFGSAFIRARKPIVA